MVDTNRPGTGAATNSVAGEPQCATPADPGRSRRSFVAVVAGSLAVLGPVTAGLVTFFSPLFRRRQSLQVRVALLSQVPEDGRPRTFPVIADRRDAWNHYAAQKIGSVYLIRQPGEQLPVAFTAKCPHAGCALGYSETDQKFTCPCHTSRFNLDGSRTCGDQEVAPRDMDTLPVKLRPLDIPGAPPVTEVLVTFIDFQTGRQEKIPAHEKETCQPDRVAG